MFVNKSLHEQRIVGSVTVEYKESLFLSVTMVIKASLPFSKESFHLNRELLLLFLATSTVVEHQIQLVLVVRRITSWRRFVFPKSIENAAAKSREAGGLLGACAGSPGCFC